jgi:hypothetical protein
MTIKIHLVTNVFNMNAVAKIIRILHKDLPNQSSNSAAGRIRSIEKFMNIYF